MKRKTIIYIVVIIIVLALIYAGYAFIHNKNQRDWIEYIRNGVK